MEDHLSESENVKQTVRQVREDLQRLLDHIDRAQGALRDISEEDEAWRPTIDEIKNGLSHHLVMLQLSYAVLSTGRRISFTCQMPNQPGHSHHKVYTCLKDTTHHFCRYHNLVNCPIDGCGGQLQ